MVLEAKDSFYVVVVMPSRPMEKPLTATVHRVRQKSSNIVKEFVGTVETQELQEVQHAHRE